MSKLSPFQNVDSALGYAVEALGESFQYLSDVKNGLNELQPVIARELEVVSEVKDRNASARSAQERAKVRDRILPLVRNCCASMGSGKIYDEIRKLEKLTNGLSNVITRPQETELLDAMLRLCQTIASDVERVLREMHPLNLGLKAFKGKIEGKS